MFMWTIEIKIQKSIQFSIAQEAQKRDDIVSTQIKINR